MEFLKEFLKDGADIEAVKSILESNKWTDLAKGNYVSKDKYQAIESKSSEYEKAIKDLTEKARASDDLPQLKKMIEEYKEVSETQKAEFAKKEKELAMRFDVMKDIGSNVHDIDDALKLYPWNKIVYSEDGSESNIKEVTKNYFTEKSYLLKNETKINTGVSQNQVEQGNDDRLNDLRIRLGVPVK